MANYWYVDINSNNLTAEAASEILKYTGENHLIRSFSYNHGNYVDGKFGGELHMNTRGLPNITSILEKYGITEDEMKWEDEFNAFYNSLPPDDELRIGMEVVNEPFEKITPPGVKTPEYDW